MRGIRRIRLGPLLTTPGRGRVRRLRQRRRDPRQLKLLHHETPPGACLHRELHIGTPGEPLGQPPAQHRPARRGDPPPQQLTGIGVQIIKRDLSTMHVEATYDRHGETSSGS
jgi:hypothetical protein